MATAEPMLHKYKELLFVIIYSVCRFVLEELTGVLLLYYYRTEH